MVIAASSQPSIAFAGITEYILSAMASSTPEWLTTEEAAEILGYHVEYMRRLASEKVLIFESHALWIGHLSAVDIIAPDLVNMPPLH